MPVFISRIESNVSSVLKADRDALLKAARKIVAGRVTYGKNAIRRAVIAAGLGPRLANAVRGASRDTPGGVEGIIFSKAKVKRPGGVFDLLQLFQVDRTIRASQGTFLAIPTKLAGRGTRGAHLSPADYPEHYFLARVKGDRGVLVPRNEPESEPYFILVRVVSQRQRLDLARIKRTLGVDLGPRIIKEWRSKRARVALQLLAA